VSIWEDVMGIIFFAGAFFLFQVVKSNSIDGKMSSTYAILVKKVLSYANILDLAQWIVKQRVTLSIN